MIGTWSTGEADMLLKTSPGVECSVFLWKHFWAEKIMIVRSVTEIQFIIPQYWGLVFVIVVCTPPSPSSSWSFSLTTLTSLMLSSAWACTVVWAYLCPTLMFVVETLVCKKEEEWYHVCSSEPAHPSTCLLEGRCKIGSSATGCPSLPMLAYLKK